MSLLTLSKRILGREEKKSSKKSTSASRGKKQEKALKQTDKKSADQSAVTPVSELAGILDLQVIVTEQAIRQHEEGLLAVRVRPQATKQQIARAVAEKFGVKPIFVRTMNMKPKVRRRGQTSGQTRAWKKAYVKVDDIQKIITGP